MSISLNPDLSEALVYSKEGNVIWTYSMNAKNRDPRGENGGREDKR